MTKATLSKLHRKGIETGAQRDLTPSEAMELQSMQQLVNGRRWEATLIKGNTALVPEGQKIADQAEAIATLLENAVRQWVASKLVECGFPQGAKCQINLTTGMILLETV